MQKKIFKKQSQLEPDYAEPYFNLANILNKFERFKEAELSYRQAIKNNPNFSMAIK